MDSIENSPKLANAIKQITIDIITLGTFIVNFFLDCVFQYDVCIIVFKEESFNFF